MGIKLCVNGNEVINDLTLLDKIRERDDIIPGINADTLDQLSSEDFAKTASIGDMSQMLTKAKYTIVAAINELVNTDIDNREDLIKQLNALKLELNLLIEETITNRIQALEETVNNRFTVVESNISEHEKKEASLVAKGHVSLSSDIDLDNEIKAATPKAVKILNDKIGVLTDTINNINNSLIDKIDFQTNVFIDAESKEMIGVRVTDVNAWCGKAVSATSTNAEKEIAKATMSKLRYNVYGAVLRLKVDNLSFGTDKIKISILKKTGENTTTPVATRLLSQDSFDSANIYQNIHVNFSYDSPKAIDNEFIVVLETLATTTPVKVTLDYITAYPVSIGVFGNKQ